MRGCKALHLPACLSNGGKWDVHTTWLSFRLLFAECSYRCSIQSTLIEAVTHFLLIPVLFLSAMTEILSIGLFRCLAILPTLCGLAFWIMTPCRICWILRWGGYRILTALLGM